MTLSWLYYERGREGGREGERERGGGGRTCMYSCVHDCMLHVCVCVGGGGTICNLTAVDRVLEVAGQSHVVVSVEVRQKISRAVWNGAITKCIHHHTTFCRHR